MRGVTSENGLCPPPTGPFPHEDTFSLFATPQIGSCVSNEATDETTPDVCLSLSRALLPFFRCFDLFNYENSASPPCECGQLCLNLTHFCLLFLVLPLLPLLLLLLFCKMLQLIKSVISESQ